MEMALLEARNMLPPSGGSEVHVHKLTDSISNAHCFNCGGSLHKGGMKLCPTQGKRCRRSNKLNHFAKFCRSVPVTPVHNLEQHLMSQFYCFWTLEPL
ncbi:hypothetical protein XELAEV_18046623mg [Xenopus laevis]|uniref:Uncharacterized protein n=1 Tax=Xenopus laevis TaxID=8355 RepID=A0A974BTF7_XENLA|nr:hypothetical protein XELAEV_18046623mg [Xenopus laevis]